MFGRDVFASVGQGARIINRVNWALPSICVVIALLALALFPPLAKAEPEKRVALVIGNSAYKNTARLENPTNDADDFAKAITALGFDVILDKDLDKRGMEQAFARFARLAQDADIAMFYYAGHAMQFGGQNYLMPIDAILQDEFSVGFEMARVDDVMNSLERARGVKILVLDACRNNPLADQLSRRASNRDYFATRGLARIQHPSGMIVAYATQADQVADDGRGRNSPFTSALIKHIAEPGVEIAQIFRRVAVDVNNSTQGRQLPDLSMSLLGEVFLTKPEKPRLTIESEAWEKIAGSHDRADFDRFIRDFPDSPFVAVANEHIRTLETIRKQEEEAAAMAARVASTQNQTVPKPAEQVAQTPDQSAQAWKVGTANSEQAPPQNTVAAPNSATQAARAPSAAHETVADATPTVPSSLTTSPSPSSPVIAALPPPNPVVPENTPPLADISQSIAHELRRLGCFTGADDITWEAGPQASLKRFLRITRLKLSSDEPTPQILDMLRLKSGRVCPVKCRFNEVEVNAECVPRKCPGGTTLSRSGACLPTPAPVRARVKIKNERPPTIVSRPPTKVARPPATVARPPTTAARPKPIATINRPTTGPDQRSCTRMCPADSSPCDPLYFKIADGRCSGAIH
jgi:uncharacterized caspase-like protein